ncbi:MAG TPA: aspartate kinase [candidate division WOR-3 bacterium]|uniref:Aspartokinase n=1 Tax=candidate division WOR-3 bacterium TaxID=2052148 RepID=A0A7V0T6F9_UNCW3|nr:aspartate kinase [candidate division WOR-3 bacterium]
MPLIVQKFGGGSLADLGRIRRVARRIASTRRKGNRVVAVVSAMGRTTDELTRLAHELSPAPRRRELDMLLTAGERQTMALLSIALTELGCEAVSFTGSQVGIITDRLHSDARIEEIRGDRLRDALCRNRVPIVAGFQGMSADREITTLGRGGSDVTAIALAAVLKAAACELNKDVEGVFTENPHEFPQARFVPEISFGELSELAGSGSEVIHPRACALAEKYRVPLVIRSAFSRKRGSIVKPTKQLEKAFVRALTHSHEIVRINLLDVPRRGRCLHQVITRLAEARIPVLLFSHGSLHGGRFDLTYYLPGRFRDPAAEILGAVAREVGTKGVELADDLASVSVVGPGIGSDPEIMSGTLDTLRQVGCHLAAFSASETRLTAFLDRKDLKTAGAALLGRFRLTGRK